MTNHILLILLNTPLIGSFILFFVPNNNKTLIKSIGLGTSVLTFFLTLIIWLQFNNSTVKFQFVDKFSWITYYDINYVIGIDSISLFFIILTSFLTIVCVLTSWNDNTKRVKEYLIAFLILECLMLHVFCVLDLILFFIFFESVLIPMFIIVGVWGSRDRKIYAAYQLVIYTLFGSIFLFLAIVLILFQVGTSEYTVLLSSNFSFDRQLILWVAFFLAFAVKVPMVPFHIWLPEAHAEAPTAGSVILAGILLKLGTYGLLRFSIPLFPMASFYFTPFVYMLSLIAIIYTALTTLRQVDLKKVIAYSSVSHMGYVTLGLFSLNTYAVEGSIFLMLSHGIVSSALFLCIGVIYDRYKTRIYLYYNGLVQTMPLYSFYFLFFTLANLSFPGTSSFIGELYIILGVFETNTIAAFIAGIGGILGASYSIWIFNRVIFGLPKVNYIFSSYDVTLREFTILNSLFLLTLLFGIYPNIVLSYLHFDIAYLVY
jgi:proton-translocating NADH-quinone oxidoreductase chain M